MSDLEQAYSKINEAIDLEPSNPDLYRIAGVILVQQAKQQLSEQRAREAITIFNRAYDLQANELNMRNYKNAKELSNRISKQVELQEQTLFSSYLYQFYPQSEDINKYFKINQLLTEKKPLKEIQCAITLVM